MARKGLPYQGQQRKRAARSAAVRMVQAQIVKKMVQVSMQEVGRMDYLHSGSPEHTIAASLGLDDESVSPAQAKKSQCPPGVLDKSSWLKGRKVFVGGIPQSMDQNDLYEMFRKFGPVQKAWPQMFQDGPESQTPTKKKHRGFGFVIFHEK